jgi:sec-independent protein translocase protein TatB
MFDIGWQELFIAAVLALIVIGPKDLPRAIRAIRNVIRKLREMARDFQSGVDDMVREAELDDVRNQINRASQLDPKKSITETVDPTGDLSSDLEFDEVRKDMSDAAQDFKRQTAPGERGGDDADGDKPKTATSTDASSTPAAGTDKQEG